MGFEHAQTFPLAFILNSPIILVILAWDLVWKSMALWKAAKQDQLYWFIAIAILNTVGILPIIYLLFFQKVKNRKEK